MLIGVALCRWGGRVHRRRGRLPADSWGREKQSDYEIAQTQVRLLLGAFLEPNELATGKPENSHTDYHLRYKNHCSGINLQAARAPVRLLGRRRRHRYIRLAKKTRAGACKVVVYPGNF